jgi:hypothetical protein
MGKEQAYKICMHVLIVAKELVEKGEPWHKSMSLEPED